MRGTPWRTSWLLLGVALLGLAGGLAVGGEGGSAKPKGPPLLKGPVILRGHEGGVRSVAFAPDGKTLAWGDRDTTVRLLDMATRKQRAALRGHGQLVSAVAYSPDGRLLASASNDQTVRLWDTATLKERATLRGHEAWVGSVA